MSIFRLKGKTYYLYRRTNADIWLIPFIAGWVLWVIYGVIFNANEMQWEEAFDFYINSSSWLAFPLMTTFIGIWILILVDRIASRPK